MTDVTAGAVPERTDAARRNNTRRRLAAERRFKYLGLAAVLAAAGFLVLLMSTIVGTGLPAFSYNYATLPLNLEEVDASDPRRANTRGILGDALEEAFPSVTGRRDKRALRGILSAGADVALAAQLDEDRALIGRVVDVPVPLSDTADLYLKGLVADLDTTTIDAAAQVVADGDAVTITTPQPVFADDVDAARASVQSRIDRLEVRIAGQGRSIEAQERIVALNEERLTTAEEGERAGYEAIIEDSRARIATSQNTVGQLTTQRDQLAAIVAAEGGTLRLRESAPSLLVAINGGIVKAEEVSATSVVGSVLRPLAGDELVAAGTWQTIRIDEPEAERKVSDQEIVWLEALRGEDRIESRWNTLFFTNGASREPEVAGIWGAVVGSFLTMVVTLILSFPVGVAAAIYLEEFAPKNRFTDFIEVNINNLAAVPSIVFGLLGLALLVLGVNLGWFTVGGVLPRSAAVTGGAVLALMTLPTIIIASRAALKSVPPSIREAGLGVGASRIQVVFHHVLPLAMPGILTGTIIGMAQALGETAPLLMIGMVAFIVDIPGGFTDPATVLPVQIYMWADFPEVGFRQKTAAAIMILLAFLILMNALAVALRKKFERRW